MAIQFLCEACEKPIEVDDPFAGRSAQCPYCRALVTVPSESTFAIGRAATPANASSGGSAPPLPGLAREPGALAHPAAGRASGNFAFAAAVVAVICQLVSSITITVMVLRRLKGVPPTPEQVQAMLGEILAQHPWIAAAEAVSLLLAGSAFLVAIFSLSRQRRGNWRAYVALFLAAAMMTCLFGGGALSRGLGM